LEADLSSATAKSSSALTTGGDAGREFVTDTFVVVIVDCGRDAISFFFRCTSFKRKQGWDFVISISLGDSLDVPEFCFIVTRQSGATGKRSSVKRKFFQGLMRGMGAQWMKETKLWPIVNARIKGEIAQPLLLIGLRPLIGPCHNSFQESLQTFWIPEIDIGLNNK
jgi:hypothetical protein